MVYHVTVMPCYDKKLEASRDDFYSEIYSTRDVDCVLTSGEFNGLFTANSIWSCNCLVTCLPLSDLFHCLWEPLMKGQGLHTFNMHIHTYVHNGTLLNINLLA